MSGRVRQILLLATFLPWCWLMMMVVHELGHVLAAWSTGATIERVILHPLTISQTVVGENPRPLVVSLAGPLMGALAPLLTWVVLRAVCAGMSGFARFFAGFCLVANGIYLALGSWTGDGDAGDLLQLGMPWGLITAVGMFLFGGGFALWHGIGATFGLRGQHELVTWRAVGLTTGLLAVTISVQLAFSSR